MRGLRRLRAATIAVTAGLALAPVVATARPGSSPKPTPVTIAAVPPAIVAGRGAAVPFAEYEAEAAASTGTRIGPSRRFGDVAAEASGRIAVRLDRLGQHIDFVLAEPADAMTLRSAIPDTRDGHGRDATLSVAIDGRRAGRIALTSRYGWFYGRYPFTNRPADGGAHHIFDEARMRFDRILPAGTVVRLSIAKGDDAPWYAIDLADFEQIPPPLQRPAGSVSIADFGADPTGRRSSVPAFEAAIAAARGTGTVVWIPPGRFRVEKHREVDRVRILGAGPWYSVVAGDGVGFYGRTAPGGSTGVELGQFAILGEVTDRVDHAQRNAIGGAMGGGSYLHDLYLQHHKVGLWFDGPMDGIRITRLRVVDCTADGLNFHRGVGHVVVEDSFFRNTGDDGLAAWSEGVADHDIVFRHDTVIAPILANGAAIYGGRDIRIVDSLFADTLTQGGGLHVGNRFGAVPLSGRIELTDDLVLRGGSTDLNGAGVGALWLYALDAPIDADIRIERLTLVDSCPLALQLAGKPIRVLTVDRLSDLHPCRSWR